MRNNGRVPFVTISFAVPFAILHSCSADGIPQLEFYAHFDLISKLFLLSSQGKGSLNSAYTTFLVVAAKMTYVITPS